MKNLRTLAVALLGIAAFASLAILSTPRPLAANSTTMGVPGTAGRPQTDTVQNARIESRYDRAIGDTSLGVNFPNVSSGTASILNLTATAALSPTGTIPYAGPFKVYVVNTGVTTLTAFVSMSRTAVTMLGGLTQTGGVVIAAGTGAIIDCQARDGETLQVRSLTATGGTCNVAVANW